jgi:hypothetical protein
MDVTPLEFKIYTYCTDKGNSNFQQLSSNLKIEILPELLPWTWDFYPKSLSVYETLKTINGETIAMVIDAYDVWAVNGATNEKLLNSIVNNFDLDKITFNAEKNCWPRADLASQYPHVDSQWKYLNAGAYVGKAKNIVNALENLLPVIKNGDDQLEFSKAYVNNLFNIEIDYKCNVFQTLYMLGQNDLTSDNGELINNITKTYPLLLHGNGKSTFKF